MPGPRHNADGPRRRLPLRSRGSASVLGIAVIGVMVALVVMMLPLYIGLSSRQAVIAAADAAALAGADTASGRIPGYVCEVAGEVAEANGATLAGCAAAGLVVTVTTHREFLGLRLTASATAGPPTELRN
jgi:secretion/DNA translocation related TadE-like protein